MVRHIMSARQKTDLLPALLRWSTTVSDGVRFDRRTAAILNVPSLRACVKYCSAPSFISARRPCDSNRSFNSQPAAVLKSP
jgi:hypothetical protein